MATFVDDARRKDIENYMYINETIVSIRFETKSDAIIYAKIQNNSIYRWLNEKRVFNSYITKKSGLPRFQIQIF